MTYTAQKAQICCDIYPKKMLKQIVNKFPEPKTSSISCCKRTVGMDFSIKPSPSVFTLSHHQEVWNWNRDPKKRMKSFPIFRWWSRQGSYLHLPKQGVSHRSSWNLKRVFHPAWLHAHVFTLEYTSMWRVLRSCLLATQIGRNMFDIKCELPFIDLSGWIHSGDLPGLWRRGAGDTRVLDGKNHVHMWQLLKLDSEAAMGPLWSRHKSGH